MYKCLWTHLKETEKPIFMYGTGNGGDKIIAALERYHVKLTGVFASDGFVRDRHFAGYKVQSYSDVRSEFGDDIIVLLAFGTTLDNVRAFIEELDKRHELIIPDVPLYGGDLFDYDYFLSHASLLLSAESLLFDEESRLLFRDAVRFRLTGKLEYLNRTENWSDSITSLLGNRKYDTVLDGGAFKGDSTHLFAEVLRPDTVIAAEADPKTFVKLSAYAENENLSHVIPMNAALWDSDGELEYISSGSRGSAHEGQNHRAKTAFVPTRSINSIFADRKADLIKLDIEGAEDIALNGAEAVILRDEPNMMISLYHRTDDLYALIKRVHDLLPGHRLYLRRIPCIPFWDLTLYAVK